MRRFYVLALFLILSPFQPAYAEPAQDEGMPSDQKSSPDLPPKEKPAVPSNEMGGDPAAASITRQPSLLSFGASAVDFDKDEPRTRGTDFRLEYRWGYSLFSAHGDWGVDFGIHPIAGAQGSTLGQLYGFGGFGFDWVFFKHVVLTESEVVGFFDSGDDKVAKPLGSFVEFRSQIELGWRFDNDIRVTAQLSHISNAGLTKRNPGEEMAGGYVHIPVSYLFGR